MMFCDLVETIGRDVMHPICSPPILRFWSRAFPLLFLRRGTTVPQCDVGMRLVQIVAVANDTQVRGNSPLPPDRAWYHTSELHQASALSRWADSHKLHTDAPFTGRRRHCCCLTATWCSPRSHGIGHPCSQEHTSIRRQPPRSTVPTALPSAASPWPRAATPAIRHGTQYVTSSANRCISEGCSINIHKTGAGRPCMGPGMNERAAREVL